MHKLQLPRNPSLTYGHKPLQCQAALFAWIWALQPRALLR